MNPVPTVNSNSFRVSLWTSALGLCLATLAGCGSGGSGAGPTGGGTTTPPVAPTFTIEANPTAVNLVAGASQTVQISVQPENDYPGGSVSISYGKLPAGISISPSTITASVTAPATVTVTLASNLSIGQQNVTFTGGQGSQTSTAPLAINIQVPTAPDPFHYIGGDPLLGFYDESRQLLFSTNMALNEVEVTSGIDGSLKARIPVPSPFGIDQMADGHTLVIGTAAQELATLDEVTHVVKTYPFSMKGGEFFTEFFPIVAALANGNVLAIAQEQGIESDNVITGGQSVVEWNPSAGTLTVVPTNGETDTLARSRDRKWAVFSADKFYLFSSASDGIEATASLNAVDPNETDVRGYAINSDGSRIAITSSDEVNILDGSLNLLGTAQLNSINVVPNDGTFMQFSPDDTKVFLVSTDPLAIEQIDVASATPQGYLPGDVLPGANVRGGFDNLLAADAEGRAWFGAGSGILTANLSDLLPLPTNSELEGAGCDTFQSSAPLNASPQVSGQSYLDGLSVYVGGQLATITDGDSAYEATYFVPPSSKVGPVDTECIDSKGNRSVNPQDVSYGVELVALSATMLPADGNVTASLYGFGFSPQNHNDPEKTPPSVTVNGTTAPVLGFVPNLGPGVLESNSIQIPSGTAGDAVQVEVSSSLGTGTLATPAVYYPTPASVPESGVLQLVSDTQRNLLYILKSSQVDVLDGATLQWKAPLTIPASFTGAVCSMAIAPDASKLVVFGLVGYQPAFIVFDLSSGQATETTFTARQYSYYPYPTQIVVTNQNKVLSGALAFDLATQTFSFVLNAQGQDVAFGGQVIRASADGSHVYSMQPDASNGQVWSYDVSTLANQTNTFGYLFWTDLAVSPDGSRFAAINSPWQEAGAAVGFFNSNAQLVNTNEYPELSPPETAAVIGAAFSPGGEVLMVPLADSLEFWDASTGTLRARLMLPQPLLPVNNLGYPLNPTVAINATGDTVYSQCTVGICVIQLPGPMDQLPAMAWPAWRPAASAAVSPMLHGSLTQRMRAMAAHQPLQSPPARKHLYRQFGAQ